MVFGWEGKVLVPGSTDSLDLGNSRMRTRLYRPIHPWQATGTKAGHPVRRAQFLYRSPLHQQS